MRQAYRIITAMTGHFDGDPHCVNALFMHCFYSLFECSLSIFVVFAAAHVSGREQSDQQLDAPYGGGQRQ